MTVPNIVTTLAYARRHVIASHSTENNLYSYPIFSTSLFPFSFFILLYQHLFIRSVTPAPHLEIIPGRPNFIAAINQQEQCGQSHYRLVLFVIVNHLSLTFMSTSTAKPVPASSPVYANGSGTASGPGKTVYQEIMVE